MTWEEVKERILRDDKDGTLTWEEVKKQVKKEKEDEEKKWEEIRKDDAEESERLVKKSTFVTSHSIKFTTDEYDKLKTAFCKGKGWSRGSPTNLYRIVLRGNYKWHPLTEVELDIRVEGTPNDS